MRQNIIFALNFIYFDRSFELANYELKVQVGCHDEIIFPKAEHFDGPEDIVQIKLKKALYARDLKMKALWKDY